MAFLWNVPARLVLPSVGPWWIRGPAWRRRADMRRTHGRPSNSPLVSHGGSLRRQYW